ncbi:MAG: serine/threonine-protein kinase [Myxococcota bacterium]
MKPGDTIDRYTVVESLGEGGMASVFGVRHTTLGTPHALKVLTVESPEIRDRLVQEGRVQARLGHPNIVAVTDVLDVDGSPGLLMEYVAGPTLDLWLANYRPTQEEALVVFRGVIGAVAHAHHEGVVHRDLKPGNVMLAIDEQGHVSPKVMDFGLAKSFVQKMRQQQTRSGTVMGTPAYMPPEQLRDASTVDRRADIYALGCILYELLTGERAFTETDRVELFKKIGGGQVTPVAELAPALPQSLADAVEGMMCPDRRFRLPDCYAVLEVLGSKATLDVITSATARETAEGLAPSRPLGPLGATRLAAGTPAAKWAAELAPPPMRSVAQLSMKPKPRTPAKARPAALPTSTDLEAPVSTGGSWLPTVLAVVAVGTLVGLVASVGLGGLVLALWAVVRAP